MTSGKSNRIAAYRKKKSWSQQQLADAVNSHWVTISKLERGRMQLTQDWLERLGKVLGVDPYQLLPDYEDQTEIYLEGYVGNGGVVTSLDVPKLTRLPTDMFDDQTSKWLRFAGDDAYPFYRDGDTIRIVYFGTEIKEDFIGRMCLIVDKADDLMKIGIIERGNSTNSFDLRPFNGPRVRSPDVEAVWLVLEIRIEPFPPPPAK